MNGAGRIAKFVVGVLWVACLVSAPAPAAAQEEGGVELGIDGLLAFRIFDDEWSGFTIDLDDAFLVSLPVKLRAGFPVTKGFSMEPSLAFDVVSIGGDTFHEVDLGLSFLRQLGGERGKTSPFLRVGGFYHATGDGDETDAQFAASAGLGVKLPMSDRLDFRVELGAKRNFSNDDYIGSWDVGSLFGLSFYTR